MVKTNNQVDNQLSEIEAIASTTYCCADSHPEHKKIKTMMERIINHVRSAKMMLSTAG